MIWDHASRLGWLAAAALQMPTLARYHGASRDFPPSFSFLCFLAKALRGSQRPRTGESVGMAWRGSVRGAAGSIPAPLKGCDRPPRPAPPADRAADPGRAA